MKEIRFLLALLGLVAFQYFWAHNQHPKSSFALSAAALSVLVLCFAFAVWGGYKRPVLHMAMVFISVFIFWRMYWVVTVWVWRDIRGIIEPIEVLNASGFFWIFGAMHSLVAAGVFAAGLLLSWLLRGKVIPPR